MEKIYVGTKVIAAEPMDEITFFNSGFGKKIGEAFWPTDKPGREGYKVRYEDNYISWSPKETFERAYREITRAERDIIEGPLNA
jgi:hypothetical protein